MNIIIIIEDGGTDMTMIERGNSSFAEIQNNEYVLYHHYQTKSTNFSLEAQVAVSAFLDSINSSLCIFCLIFNQFPFIL